MSQPKPTFSQALEQLRPRWGAGAVVSIFLFFFLPEILSCCFADELRAYFELYFAPILGADSWLYNRLIESLTEVSYLNVILGALMLWWSYKGKTDV